VTWRRKDKGVRLFVWRAHYSQAVRHLTLHGRILTHERRTNEPELTVWAVPAE